MLQIIDSYRIPSPKLSEEGGKVVKSERKIGGYSRPTKFVHLMNQKTYDTVTKLRRNGVPEREITLQLGIPYGSLHTYKVFFPEFRDALNTMPDEETVIEMKKPAPAPEQQTLNIDPIQTALPSRVEENETKDAVAPADYKAKYETLLKDFDKQIEDKFKEIEAIEKEKETFIKYCGKLFNE
jgi:hypothetical protein